MDRNEELAESLKKHEHEHRNLASILLNAKAKTEGITYRVSLILLSLEAYLNWKKGLRPEWEWVNMEECKAEGDDKEMESFLKANPLPEPHEQKKERLKKATEMNNFKKLLNSPKSLWKLIDGGKGGAR